MGFSLILSEIANGILIFGMGISMAYQRKGGKKHSYHLGIPVNVKNKIIMIIIIDKRAAM